MSAIFRDARLKIERANKHIADAEDAILALVDTKTATVQHDSDTGYQRLIHDIPEHENALLNLSLIIGDALHNLRTALDYGWASALDKHVPAAVSDFNKFPIRDTREQVEDALHGLKIQARCPALFEIIVSNIQPYEGGQAGVLHALNALDISDKHLLLLELSPRGGVKGIVVKKADGDIIRGSSYLAFTPPPYIVIFDKDIEIQDKGELSFTITVQEAGIFKGLPIRHLLSGFSQYVFYVMELLENL